LVANQLKRLLAHSTQKQLRGGVFAGVASLETGAIDYGGTLNDGTNWCNSLASSLCDFRGQREAAFVAYGDLGAFD